MSVMSHQKPAALTTLPKAVTRGKLCQPLMQPSNKLGINIDRVSAARHSRRRDAGSPLSQCGPGHVLLLPNPRERQVTSHPQVRTPAASRRTRRATVVAIATVLAATAAPVATARTGVDQGAPDYYDSGLAPTPYMGWNTYYGLGAPTEQQVRSVADKLVDSGLREAGYDIVWLDGGWQADNPRDANGRLVANPDRFPSGIPALVSYLHKRGLKVGIYTDAGDLRRRQELRARQQGPLRRGRTAVRGLEDRRGQGRLPVRDRRQARSGPGVQGVQRRGGQVRPQDAAEPVQPAHRRLGPAAHARAGRAQHVRLRPDDRRLLAHRHGHRLGHPEPRPVAQHPAQHGCERLAPRGAGTRALQRPGLPHPDAPNGRRIPGVDAGGVNYAVRDVGRDGVAARPGFRPAHPVRLDARDPAQPGDHRRRPGPARRPGRTRGQRLGRGRVQQGPGRARAARGRPAQPVRPTRPAHGAVRRCRARRAGPGPGPASSHRPGHAHGVVHRRSPGARHRVPQADRGGRTARYEPGPEGHGESCRRA